MVNECLGVWLESLLVVLGVGLVVFIIIAYKRVRIAKSKDYFKCCRCGNCCRLRFISVTDDEIDRLKKIGHKEFFEKNNIKRINGRCYFQKDGSCGIYKDRPKVCREFPFGKLLGFITYCKNVNYCPGVEELERRV